MRKTLLLTATLLASATPAYAQQSHDHGTSPYVGLESREIKALSDADVRALLDGEGMSLALPAELNGYPGPRHVLELADSLELTPVQREDVQRIMDAMLAEAKSLGARIVEAERALDRAFSTGTVSESGLREAVAESASLMGELRAVHLAAHIGTKNVLTLHQTTRYSALRGYTTGHGGHEGHGTLRP